MARSAFAKFGSTPATAQWLRAESGVYGKLGGRFMPGVLGYEDDAERPLLLLEDLSAAWWPPPWRPGDVERLVETMREVATGCSPRVLAGDPSTTCDRPSPEPQPSALA